MSYDALRSAALKNYQMDSGPADSACFSQIVARPDGIHPSNSHPRFVKTAYEVCSLHLSRANDLFRAHTRALAMDELGAQLVTNTSDAEAVAQLMAAFDANRIAATDAECEVAATAVAAAHAANDHARMYEACRRQGLAPALQLRRRRTMALRPPARARARARRRARGEPREMSACHERNG